MNQDEIEIINALTTVNECIEIENQAKSQKNLSLASAAREKLCVISINNLKTEKECENFAKNAEKRQRPDLVELIHRKSIDLAIKKHPDFSSLRVVEIECLKAIYCYEKVLKIKNGKTTKANYTWKSISNHGIINAVDKLVSKTDDTMGFTHLNKIGLADYSFEAIVIRYPNSFSNKAAEQAKLRLS